MAARAKKRNAAATTPETLKTPCGASAEVLGELLILRDRKGAIVVVFDAEKGSAEIVAPRGDLTFAAPEGKISLRAAEISVAAGRLEIRAERILEHAGEVYREVEGMLQVRAERVRTIARDVFQVLAKRARVVAEEDASLDGKRVLLG